MKAQKLEGNFSTATGQSAVESDIFYKDLLFIRNKHLFMPNPHLDAHFSVQLIFISSILLNTLTFANLFLMQQKT